MSAYKKYYRQCFAKLYIAVIQNDKQDIERGNAFLKKINRLFEINRISILSIMLKEAIYSNLIPHSNKC